MTEPAHGDWSKHQNTGALLIGSPSLSAMRYSILRVALLMMWWAQPCAPAAAFDCAPATCPQIKTCAEARYKLEVCHDNARDADNDGIPCEDVCGKDKETYTARANADSGSGTVFGQGLTTVPAPLTLFTCAGKRTCKEMISCEEATYYLNICGVKSLDRDHDGRPCNTLCR